MRCLTGAYYAIALHHRHKACVEVQVERTNIAYLQHDVRVGRRFRQTDAPHQRYAGASAQINESTKASAARFLQYPAQAPVAFHVALEFVVEGVSASSHASRKQRGVVLA